MLSAKARAVAEIGASAAAADARCARHCRRVPGAAGFGKIKMGLGGVGEVPCRSTAASSRRALSGWCAISCSTPTKKRRQDRIGTACARVDELPPRRVEPALRIEAHSSTNNESERAVDDLPRRFVRWSGSDFSKEPDWPAGRGSSAGDDHDGCGRGNHPESSRSRKRRRIGMGAVVPASRSSRRIAEPNLTAS